MDYEFDIYDFDVIRDILSEDFCDNFVEFIIDNYECELKDKDDNPLVYIGIGLAYLENKKKLTKKLLERIIKALKTESGELSVYEDIKHRTGNFTTERHYSGVMLSSNEVTVSAEDLTARDLSFSASTCKEIINDTTVI